MPLTLAPKADPSLELVIWWNCVWKEQGLVRARLKGDRILRFAGCSPLRSCGKASVPRLPVLGIGVGRLGLESWLSKWQNVWGTGQLRVRVAEAQSPFGLLGAVRENSGDVEVMFGGSPGYRSYDGGGRAVRGLWS